jgi:Helicase HerA, central domain
VLRRGSRARGLRPDDPEGDGEPTVGRRPYTPIYERDLVRVRPVSPEISLGRKTVGDRLLELMSDGQPHGVMEMEAILPDGEWARAMKVLLSQGFAFDRMFPSDAFRIRRKFLSERKQSLVELLDGLGTPVAGPAVPGVAAAEIEVPVVPPRPRDEEPEPFDPTEDEGATDVVEEQLHLSLDDDGLALSASDSATMTAAILAKRGSGKTYLGMVLAEEFLGCPSLGVPVVIVDPTGVWYGLRSMADGSPSSLPILTLGGEYGDMQLSHGQGEQAALVVQDIRPQSIILDLSLMAPVQQHEFVADFVLKLFMLSVRSPLHLIIDEADEFAPQSLTGSKHQKRSLEEIDRFVRRGRKRGLGTTLISQRPAVVNKNVLSQIDSLFLLNMVSPGDLEAVADWLKLRVTTEQRLECLGQLANLSPGVAFFSQSGANPKFRKFKVRTKDTFDSGRTPKPNEEIVVPSLARVSADIMEAAARHLGVGGGENLDDSPEGDD